MEMTRREWLKSNLLGTIGIGLGGLFPGNLDASNLQVTGSPRAKRCLMMFMWGGPAHQDLWDLKPLAPAEYRGEFQPIPTVAPGIEIGEHLPHIARHTDKMCFIRSVTHSDNNHSTSAHWMMTGHKHRVAAENFNARGDDFPHIGSVLTKLTPGSRSLPTFVALPIQIATTAGAVTPGQGGGILGARYDPFRIDQYPDEANFQVPNLTLPDGVSTDRMNDRMALLSRFDGHPPAIDPRQREALGAFETRATEMLTSDQARRAFDLRAESDAVRDAYGRGTFGQGLLLARRLLESGVRLVTVYWHRDRSGGDSSWDTHANNFGQLKNRLIPQVDRPIASLLQDLQDRGLLEDTLVVWNSEFGRTPKVNNNQGGRDHWGKCNTVWMAGAGIPGGNVYGKSDSIASSPDENPISPADFSATIYHLLGLDPKMVVYDQLQRPFAISEGRVLREIL